MDSLLEYTLDSICVLKVCDYKCFGLHMLVWSLLGKGRIIYNQLGAGYMQGLGGGGRNVFGDVLGEGVKIK